jgi:tol-pal system protein YbgF
MRPQAALYRASASAVIVLAMLAATLTPGHAQDRDIEILTNRVQELEQQVRALQGRSGAGGGPAAARLEVRQSQYEDELRALTGRVEDLSYQLRQLADKLDKLAADVDYRLGQPQAGAAPSPGAGEPAPPGAASGQAHAERRPGVLGTMRPREPGSAPANGATASGETTSQTPQQQYAGAYDLLRQGRYDQAETAFSAFLQQHPDDPLAENARYWLGETFYARGDFARATEAFVEGYQKSRTGPKAPDTLLKLGMSLAAMGKNKEACATFRELGKTFPDASSAIKEKAAQETRRAGCS